MKISFLPLFLFPLAGSVFGERVLRALPAEIPKAIVVRKALMPESLADPLEPLNRSVWEVNNAVLKAIAVPVSRAYGAVVPPPVRTGLGNAARNIAYPGRLVNHALQGRWDGADIETKRFLCNSTLGVAGLFDVATDMGIPKSEAGFSQTFRHWGWQPHSFVVLPFLGPSDDRAATGLLFDKAAEPWNYVKPWNIASTAATFDNYAGSTEEALRLVEAESDFYSLAKHAWTYSNLDHPPDWSVTCKPDPATLQTLAAGTATCQDRKFPGRGKELSVVIPTTGKRLKCQYWLQPAPTRAPLVYIVPGMGGHRLSTASIALAESLFLRGASVVTTTSVFHPEFQENAASTALPGYIPEDRLDLLRALTAFDQAFSVKFPNRLTTRALVGTSMGGFFTMALAATEAPAGGFITFDRYVAVNPPVDLANAEKVLDDYQNAPLAWPHVQRQKRINNTVHKALAGGFLTGQAVDAKKFPLDGIESKYLIGLSFRLTLRDIIFSSQLRYNLGILQTPLSTTRREACYQEISGWTFQDYQKYFVGSKHPTPSPERNLRSHQTALKAGQKLRVLTNQNDFLLTERDREWLKSVLGSRLQIFPNGGHLGNLNTPPIQAAVCEALGL